jgi:hypothetical protein
MLVASMDAPGGQLLWLRPPDWSHCGDYALEGRATCRRPRCNDVCRREQSEKVTEQIHVSGRGKPFWALRAPRI